MRGPFESGLPCVADGHGMVSVRARPFKMRRWFGQADPDDAGELPCGMFTAAPPDFCHGDADWKISLDQKVSQPKSPNVSQVPHGRHPES